mmetsp:Transcript_58564/g.137584  ORF Transcript_58564/g.137584 Transcript_58564/m.137584 type:complete len:339 (-) Transcript_58564:1021-2037(-)
MGFLHCPKDIGWPQLSGGSFIIGDPPAPIVILDLHEQSAKRSICQFSKRNHQVCSSVVGGHDATNTSVVHLLQHDLWISVSNLVKLHKAHELHSATNVDRDRLSCSIPCQLLQQRSQRERLRKQLPTVQPFTTVGRQQQHDLCNKLATLAPAHEAVANLGCQDLEHCWKVAGCAAWSITFSAQWRGLPVPHSSCSLGENRFRRVGHNHFAAIRGNSQQSCHVLGHQALGIAVSRQDVHGQPNSGNCQQTQALVIQQLWNVEISVPRLKCQLAHAHIHRRLNGLVCHPQRPSIATDVPWLCLCFTGHTSRLRHRCICCTSTIPGVEASEQSDHRIAQPP